MESILDRVESKGRSEGLLVGQVKVYSEDLHFTPEQIAAKLEKSVDDINKILSGMKSK